MQRLALVLLLTIGVGACVPAQRTQLLESTEGEVMSLDDRRFSTANVRHGMWLPDTFRERVRGGLYFLEGRDPTRIPVLFIHGINGSPRDFNLLILGLDRRRYQPCVYFYASGARLWLSAEDLAQELRMLRSNDGFERVILIAHSMGGLIARDVLVNHSLGGLDVPVLITISTPWNGHAGAAFGARFAPVVVPAWLDLAQGSTYLEGLFADRSGRPRRWPDAVCHHLIFTYGRRWTSLGVSGDEVVTVASQLSRPAQAQAARIYGFNTTHAQVLSDAALGQLVSAILSDYRVDSRVRRE